MSLLNPHAAGAMRRLFRFVADLFAPAPLSARPTMNAPRRFCRLAALLFVGGLFAVVAAPSQAQTPTATIASPQDGGVINEGEDFNFTVSIDMPPTCDPTMFSLTETENPVNTHLDPDRVTALYQISGDDTSLTAALSTVDDQMADLDSTVTISVETGEGTCYNLLPLGATGTSVSVTIYDNDQATYEVSAPPDGVAEGGALTYSVAMAMNGRTNPVLIDYTTVDGAATAGEDYTATSGTLTFTADGEMDITVPTIDDTEAEQERESVTLRLRPKGAQGPAQFQADIISDELLASSSRQNNVIMPQLAAAITGGVSRALHDRIIATLDGGPITHGLPDQAALLARSRVAAAGAFNQSNYRDRLGGLGIDDFKFSNVLNAQHGGFLSRLEVGSLTMWGQGYFEGLEVEPDDGGLAFTAEGDMQGVLLGLDAHSDDLVLGLALNNTQAEMDYDLDNGAAKGAHKTDLFGVYPYVGKRLDSGTRLWGGVGSSRGEVEIIAEGATAADAVKFDIKLRSLSIGGDAPMRTELHGDQRGATTINIIGAVDATRLTGKETTDNGEPNIAAETFTLRAGAKYGHTRLSDIGAWNANARATFRQDFGDGQEGTGLELGGGAQWVVPESGLRMHVDARVLLAHAEQLSEWGISGNVRWYALGSPAFSGNALSVELKPQWGGMSSDNGQYNEQLWRDGIQRRYDSAATAAPRYDWEMRYHLALPRDDRALQLFTRDRNHRRGLGADYRIADSLTAGVEAVVSPAPDRRGYIRYQWRLR